VLDKAEYSAFESTLNSSIVSYHTCLFTYLPMTVYDCVRCREWSRRLHTSTRRSRMSSYLHQRSTANRYQYTHVLDSTLPCSGTLKNVLAVLFFFLRVFLFQRYKLTAAPRCKLCALCRTQHCSLMLPCTGESRY